MSKRYPNQVARDAPETGAWSFFIKRPEMEHAKTESGTEAQSIEGERKV